MSDLASNPDSRFSRDAAHTSCPLIGLDDYEATGVDLDQIIIGIPWFGYNYTCETFSNNSNSAVSSCQIKRFILIQPAYLANSKV